MKQSDRFDRMLTDAAGNMEFTVEELTEVNPWEKPMHLMLGGMILSTVLLDIAGLNYFLPVLGSILFYGGARVFRRVNRWFSAVWLLSTADFMLGFLKMAAACLPEKPDSVQGIWTYILFGTFGCLKLWILDRAIVTEFRKAGQKMKHRPLLWAMLCQAVITLLLILGSEAEGSGMLLPAVILGVYIPVFICFYKVPGQMQGTGYLYQTAGIKCSLSQLIGGCLGICLICVTGLSLWANYFALVPQDTPLKVTANSAVRERLLEKGFPKEMLAEMDDSDAELFVNAVRVRTGEGERSEDDSASVRMVSVSVPGEEGYIAAYFKFGSSARNWHSGFSLQGYERLFSTEAVSGRLLYEQDGKTVSGKMKKGPGASFDFAYPSGSSNQRGYVIFKRTVAAYEDRDLLLDAAVLEFCTLPKFNYPYRTAAEENERLFGNEEQYYDRF